MKVEEKLSRKKNKMNKIKLIIVLTLTSSLIFFSCSSNEIESSIDEQSISPTEIGKLHNDVLRSLIFDDNNSGKIKYLLTNDLLEEKILEILNKKDPLIFNSALLEKVKKDYNDNFLKNNKNELKNLKSTNTDIFIDYLVDNNKISSELSEHFYLIFNYVKDVENNNETIILKEIEDLKKINFNESDQKYADVFISTFEASYTFWNDEFPNWQSKQKSGINNKVNWGWRDVTVIWADAAGAAAGLAVSGGFGSIFLGAYTSTAVGSLVFNIE